MSLEEILNQALQKTLPFKALDPVTDQSLYELVRGLGVKSQELLIVLEELLMNSQEHGGGHPRLFYDVSDDQLCFLLRDDGQGIHQHVPRNPRLSDTKGKATTSILRLALEEGITGTGTIGRGMGLFYLSKFVSEHGAESLVASDQGMILQQGGQFYEKLTSCEIEGTMILVRVAAREVGI